MVESPGSDAGPAVIVPPLGDLLCTLHTTGRTAWWLTVEQADTYVHIPALLIDTLAEHAGAVPTPDGLPLGEVVQDPTHGAVLVLRAVDRTVRYRLGDLVDEDDWRRITALSQRPAYVYEPAPYWPAWLLPEED